MLENTYVAEDKSVHPAANILLSGYNGRIKVGS